MKIQFYISVILLFLLSCGPSEDAKYFRNLLEIKENTLKPSVDFPREKLYEIIEQIPSPLEVSNLIKESGANYNEYMLNDVGYADDYNNKYTQAVNLGVYGTDLGYINIYSKYAASMLYMSSVQDLASQLRIGQFFDFSTISRLAANSENIDSILYISTAGFDNMSSYLRKQERDDVSVLMIVGGWIEAIYIITQVTRRYPTPKLIERIGEQKILLDDLLLIISLYQHDNYFNRIFNDLNILQSNFENVEIEYVVGEREMIEVDGMLVVQDKNESIVRLDDKTLNNITQTIQQIRTFLVETDV